MAYPFTEEHEFIREAVRRRLADWRDAGGLEAVVEEGRGCDLAFWAEARTELGWPGIAIEEDYGGAGLGLLGRTVLMEEMGAALMPAPFFASSCLAADHIEAFGSEEKKQELLGALAAGELTAAFVDGRNVNGRSALRMDGDRLSGAVDHVIDGAFGETLVVMIEAGAGTYKVFAVPAASDGVSIEPHGAMDPTRGLACVAFRDVQLDNAFLVGEGGDKEAALAMSASAISLAAECVGGAQRCLDMTVDYAKERVQFDRPIASFQAVKHRCADMMIAVEASRSAVYGAAAAAREDWPEYGAIALAYAGESFFKVAGDAIQMHGGIGFCWEYPLHFYFKRARANRSALGAPSHHYESLARRIGLDGRGEAA